MEPFSCPFNVCRRSIWNCNTVALEVAKSQACVFSELNVLFAVIMIFQKLIFLLNLIQKMFNCESCLPNFFHKLIRRQDSCIFYRLFKYMKNMLYPHGKQNLGLHIRKARNNRVRIILSYTVWPKSPFTMRKCANV